MNKLLYSVQEMNNLLYGDDDSQQNIKWVLIKHKITRKKSWVQDLFD